ncbi:MAG: hypothetical protein AAF717_07285 [Bacteroidota bacterium]
MSKWDVKQLWEKIQETLAVVDSANDAYKNRNLSDAIGRMETVLTSVEEIQRDCPSRVILELEAIISKENPITINSFLTDIKNEMVHFKGISQMQLGEYQGALATLSVFVNNSSATGSFEHRYRTLLVFVQIAQLIPKRSTVIDKTYSQIEAYLNSVNKSEYNSELLLFRSRFEFLKGNLDQALGLAKEALLSKKLLKKHRDINYGQVWDFHFDGLVSISLMLHKIDQAKKYVKEWENSDNTMPANRLVRMNKCRSDIARFEGDFSKAVKFAKRGLRYAEESDYRETYYAVTCSLFHAYIEWNKSEEVTKNLFRLDRLEASQRLFVNYHAALIRLRHAEQSEWIESRINSEHLTAPLDQLGLELDSLLGITYYSDYNSNHLKTIVY